MKFAKKIATGIIGGILSISPLNNDVSGAELSNRSGNTEVSGQAISGESAQIIAARKYLIEHRKYFGVDQVRRRFNVPSVYRTKLGIDPSSLIDEKNRTINLALANPSLAHMINIYSRQEGVNPKLLMAYAIAESNFGSNVGTSSAGAISALQVMPNILKRMGLDPNKSEDHYLGALRLIKEAGRVHGIDVSKAKFTPEEIVVLAASYNAGTFAVRADPEKVFFRYRETNNHIKIVFSAMMFDFIIPNGIERNEEVGLWVATSTRKI